MNGELLQQVRLLDPVTGTDRVTDVLLRDGRVEAIGHGLCAPDDRTQVRDCRGWVLGPGLVDLYSHSPEPGFEQRESLEDLLRAAVAGGFTRLNLLPDTWPVVDHGSAVTSLHHRLHRALHKILSPESGVQVGIWGALTQGLQGQKMTELGELAASGIVGFTDGQPWENGALLRRSLEYLQSFEKTIALWPCNHQLTGGGVLREGADALKFGLPGIPAIAETGPLATLLEYGEILTQPIHIMRVSTARSVALIQGAKERGYPITASTTWMHLLWNTSDVASYDPNLHLAPSLGTPADQSALITGIQDGVLEAIAIDHRAYTYEEKTVPFAVSPPGVIGLELALPLLWSRFVETGKWSALRLWSALSAGPDQCLGQPMRAIAPNQPTELTLFDPHPVWTVSEDTLKSGGINTPWYGAQIQGRVVQTWCASSTDTHPSISP